MDSTLIIRPFIEKDLPALCDMENHSEYARWSRKSLEDEVSSGSSAIVLTAVMTCGRTGAADTEKVTGYISFIILWEELHIRKIVVHPRFRSMGIASALIHEAETSAIRAGVTQAVLEVAASNIAAVNLYRKNGFEFVRAVDKPGSVPLVMVKKYELFHEYQ